MNVIDRIGALMQSDLEDPDGQSDLLRREYDRADQHTRDAIDAVVICLCGYSLTTLLEDPTIGNPDEEEEEEEEEG